MAVLRNPRTKIRQFFCEDLPFHFTQRQMPSTASAGDGLLQGFSEDASWSKQMRHDAPKVLIQSWLKGTACCQMKQAIPHNTLTINNLTDEPNIPGLQDFRLIF